ncbi:hypothetical protein POM88_001935 [Heracleum sosnowskyi]|uniref:Uncharacterized protein n=1 Tax=Heracleum sosnowskyi TaxID=360622 RepID=A0AAD8N5H1_9APIA|nr:hypothetical protein POM88_001935 [Heracleum sosnowskyi]
MILKNEIEQLFGDGDEFWTRDSPTKSYVGQVFASIDAAFSCYKGYSSFSGFQVCRSTQKTIRGVIVSKYFVCSKAGSADNSYSQDDDDIEFEASRISATVGPVKKKTNRFWNFAFNAASSNTGPVKTFNFLKSLTGSYAAVGATAVDIKNWMRDIKFTDLTVITIHPPLQSNNKGSRKRIVGPAEKSADGRDRVRRMCKSCKKKSYHDSHNCPQKGLEKNLSVHQVEEPLNGEDTEMSDRNEEYIE